MDIIEVFAKNVKKYRNKMGLSQEAFVEKSGLHRTYISALECKKRSIDLDNLQKIADALEIGPYLLFKE
ncbi:helix-turn-helix domain-containing protein [Anaerococcus lactolyticus]|uniref:Restriction-modification system control element Bcll n=1 Tax=Anaerococcus lactolyticus S7-1-13 TaxID=1284686 RepID=A0A095X0Q1_9FIRM|nr:helix-turn-helix transcriptional regulator [Anaerococcus lactolyticus]KGF03408.1 restriction-modification system control element Bcll [Anaerococcus lactolyticus S7-1-13]